MHHVTARLRAPSQPMVAERSPGSVSSQASPSRGLGPCSSALPCLAVKTRAPRKHSLGLKHRTHSRLGSCRPGSDMSPLSTYPLFFWGFDEGNIRLVIRRDLAPAHRPCRAKFGV
jgi:hypothetical protein